MPLAAPWKHPESEKLERVNPKLWFEIWSRAFFLAMKIDANISGSEIGSGVAVEWQGLAVDWQCGSEIGSGIGSGVAVEWHCGSGIGSGVAVD